MKNFKGIVSIILVITMLCAVFSVMGTASAATVEETTSQETVSNYNLADNVQDGVILHAFCWGYSEIEKNLESIAKAGYTAIQTSPVQQPKDMCPSTNISGQWWKLYQPASLAIAEKSWLGTKEELTSLCAAAEKYGIKIICDIVSNHLGASSDDNIAHYGLADEVATYEPTIWNGDGLVAAPGYTKDNPYIHQNFGISDDTSPKSVTQLMSSGCPDLDTSNKYIQQKVSDLLKDCIDCGVDGFRFDAAKHIETPDDGDVASDYWPTVLGAARDYAAEKGQTIYTYGEILNTPGRNREYSSYTNLGLSITANVESRQTLSGMLNRNPEGVAVGNYGVGTADKAVLWVESHDTYFNSSETTNIPNEDIVKTWAIVASRKDATALYYPRPTSMKMGTIATDATYKSVAVAEVNKFHNQCVGEDELLSYNDNFTYVVRGQKGVVIVDVAGNTKDAVIENTGLADGEYKDMITGNVFTVTDGTVTGTVGSTGVAVVTKGETTPSAATDKESCTFNGETLALKLSLTNAETGTFSLDGCAPIAFENGATIKIGKGYEYGETITLTLTAIDGEKENTTVYKYLKKQAPTSGVYTMISQNAAKMDGKNWTAPLYAYVYKEWYEDGKKCVYSNDVWPGQEMEYDEANDCYYIELQDNYCTYSVDDEVVDANADFNLATSMDTMVVFSDSSAKAGSVSQGKQYPFSGMKGLPLSKKSHLLEKQNVRNWVVTTLVPGYKERVYATEVAKDGSIVIPSYKIGDVNYDNVVNVNDATAVQYFLADLKALDCGINVADVNRDGKVTIMDVTYIQRFAANMGNCGEAGNVVQGDEGDAPTTAKPTEPAPSETTPPVVEETYTAYVSSNLTWLDGDGCSVYLFDKKSGDSYFMKKDTEKYPNVYTAEVPVSCTDVIFYRALGMTTDPENDNNAYNLQFATISKTNNCYYWENDGGKVGAYVEQQKPTGGLERVYVDNSSAKWSEVYIFGWGCGMNNVAYKMTQIQGTDIWYFDLPEAIPSGVETFLFKDTADGWVNQSANVKVDLPNNCYKLDANSNAAGTWYKYN